MGHMLPWLMIIGLSHPLLKKFTVGGLFQLYGPVWTSKLSAHKFHIILYIYIHTHFFFRQSKSKQEKG